jgi:site-specific DNA-methyltransferase (adenine-specific)
MAEQEDGAVDHVICDPPYDERTHAHARTMLRRAPGVGLRESGLMGRKMDIDFAPVNPAEVAPAIVRLASRWAIAFCALEQMGKYADAAGDAWVRGCAWVRTDGAPQFTGDRPAQALDGIAVMHRKGRKRWNGGGRRGYWIGTTVHPRTAAATTETTFTGARLHPTQKPLWLMLDLVRLFTDPGDLVFDGHFGSGTTGVACLRLGRRFVGCEINEQYFAVAVERLRAAERDTTVEADRAGQVPLFGDAP